jgi:hypothetical protein
LKLHIVILEHRCTTDNLALVNYRLGEVRGEKEAMAGEALERERKMHLFQSTAVEYLMRSK